ncbi:MAG: hypothetical protein JXP34_10335 [Planctomycetes bacterium]|nr:hypothetical protein [Planctomycetota bacterium]
MRTSIAFALAAFVAAPRAGAEIERIHILVFAHTDIGFTHAPDTVARRYRDGLDRAIDLCLAEPEFRWNIEAIWQYRQWRRRTDDPERIALLRRLVREGRIAIGAAWATMHSGLLGDEEACRLFHPAREVEEELGVDLAYAFQDDVPGHTGDYPQIFARSGVRGLIAGLNLFIGGAPSVPATARPFLWRGRDGSRLIAWMSPDSYVEAEEWGLGVWSKTGDATRKVPEKIRALERSGYPYADFLLLGSLGDNVETSAAESVLRKVRAWNETGARPRIIFSTPEMFFRTLGDPPLPEYEGDGEGCWELVKAGAPSAVACTREAKRAAHELEVFGSVAAILPALSADPGAGIRARSYRFPSLDLRAIYEDLLTYDEHTAAAEVGWPKLCDKDDTDRANEIHYAVARSADASARDLRRWAFDAVIGQLDLRGSEVIAFNPSTWTRTDRVEARLDGAAPAALVDAETGAAIPFAVLPLPDRIAFVARDVPPVGIRRYRLAGAKPAPPAAPSDAPEVRFEGGALACGGTRVEVAPGGSIRSIRIGGREIAGPGFGTLAKGSPNAGFRDVPLDGEASVSGSGGPAVGEIVVERRGSALPRKRIRVTPGIDRVEIELTLDIAHLPDSVRGKDSYAIRFPFASRGEIILDGPLGFRRTTKRLPGSRPLVLVARRGIVLAGGGGYTALASLDAPLFLPPPRGSASTDSLTVLVYDRTGEGETRDLGKVRFERTEPAADTLRRFRFILHALPPGFDPIAADRALEAGMLSAVVVRPWGPQAGPIREASRSFLSLEPAGVVLQSFHPAAFGDRRDWIVRIREIAGASGAARIRWPWSRVHVARANLAEEPTGEVAGEAIPFGPYEVVTLRVRPE